MSSETCKVGKRGTVGIPAALRRRFGMEEGTLVIAEERAEGILLRPAVAVPVETYTPERRAAFLLSNAVDTVDDAPARAEVCTMRGEPDDIPHAKPIQKTRGR